MKQTLLICGDSFAADWSKKYPGAGWPNYLTKDFNVTNLAQAGCSEYKIYQQLTSVDASKFDRVIISHTSPYRIPVATHPVHSKDLLHHSSDLIYTDIKEHSKSNNKLLPLVDFFENYFDTDWAVFSHSLLCEKIESLAPNSTIHTVHCDWDNLHKFNRMINFNDVFKAHNGLLNHYSNQGNGIVYNRLLKELV